MNPRYYHLQTPLLDPRRKLCPVCHYAAYSRGGIHPQCAERQADPPRPKGKARVLPRQDEQAAHGGAKAVAEKPPAG